MTRECSGQFDPTILAAFGTAAPWFEKIFINADR